MLKRVFLLQLLLLGVYFYCFAQPKPNTYEPVKPTGEIPKDMLIKSSKKYEVEKSTISKDESRKDRKTKESFYLSTNFEIDKLLLSGQVSFNDPITIYLNKIVDVLLKDEPALRKQVRVYTMKSTSMNAFATNQGIIFVNLGLLARINNEAELAFILAHEITHVEEKHSLNKYLKVRTIERDKDLYKDLSLDDKLATVNHYSRELETEADEHGLERYLKAGYSLDAIDGSFTALAYSHHPFVEYEFNHKWLESSTFTFPQEFGREKTNSLKPLEDDDTTSTHPSIPQRKENILAKIKDVSPDGRKLTLVSETDFNATKEFAQFEVCRLHLARQRYDLAVYEAQALLKQYPENLFLKKVILHAMAAMAYFSHDGISIREWEDYVNEDLQGNVQRAYHFHLSLAIDPDYIATVATRYGWQLKQQYPTDKEIQITTDSLMHLLFYKREVEPEFFSMTPRPQTELDSIALEYQYLANPALREEHKRQQDSIANAATKPAVDVVVDGDSNLINTSIKTVSTLSSPTIDDNKNDTDSDDNSIVSDEYEYPEEEEDTTLVRTVAEAKKMKVKLTGYEKYQLKNKDRYDIKGFKLDGTVVYNERDYSENNRSRNEVEDRDTDADNDDNNSEDSGREDNNREDASSGEADAESDTAAADSAIVEEVVYYHKFTTPLDQEFHKYAFVDFANNEAFMKQAKLYYSQMKKDEDKELSKTELKKKVKEEELNKNRGYALNIKKVVVVNPRYSKINLVNPEKQQYLTSEKNQKRFSDILKSSAKASDIQFQLIDNKELKNKEVATFNDIAFLNEWLDERLELGSTVPLSSMDLAEREALAKKYGTRYFMWTGNLSVKERDYLRGLLITYSVIFPPMLPFSLPRLLRGGKYQIYYYIVFDIITNQMVLGDVVVSNQLERNDFINSQTYYTFHQLKYNR